MKKVRLKASILSLNLISFALLFTSCHKAEQPATIGRLKVKADSQVYKINRNRSVSISKDIEKKEFKINFIFAENCDEIGDDKYAFQIHFAAEQSLTKDGDTTDYSFLEKLTFFDQDKKIMPLDEYFHLNGYKINNSYSIYMNYSNVGDFGVDIFDNEKYPLIFLARLSYWEGCTSGGYVLLKSENY